MRNLIAYVRSLRQERESGQAMIFFGIVAMTVLLTTGVAVEGGRIFVTYRHMQTAADMAALVGAQSLPNNPTTAASDACNYAQRNGFGNGTCTSSPPSATSPDSSSVSACVPPASRTPYDTHIASYGGSTSGCSAPTSSIYIEVQIAYNLGTIPVFNTPVTLYSHAVARNGVPDVTDYAVVAMNSTSSISGGAMKLSGSNGVVVVGSTFINSTDPASFVTSGSGHQQMCNGQWLNSSSESMPGNLYTYSGSILAPSYSPPGCGGATSSAVSSRDYISNAGKISDPYGDTDCPDASPATETNVGYQSCPPSPIPSSATGTNLQNNCAACVQTAWYLDRKNSKWLQATSSLPSASGTDVLELFPGVYPGGICMSGGTVYMNPGVYILGGNCSGSDSFKSTGGKLCVFGAPVCDVINGSWDTWTTQFSNSNKTVIPYYISSQGKWSTGDCGSANFTNTADPAYVSPESWYHYCSPWGYWDPNVASENVTCTLTGCSGSTGHPTSLTTAPVFLNQDGTASTTPLNGVTLYARTGSVEITGNAGQALAMPNPCYGNGSATTGTVPPSTTTSAGAVSFPTGRNSQQYSYPSTSLANVGTTIGTGLAGTTSSGATLYPNADMETQCLDSSGNTLNLQVWNNEFSHRSYPIGQHLHFLIFAKSSSATVKLAGGGQQNWWGIVHTWPFQTSGSFPGPPSNEGYTADSVTVTGSAGGSNGPPMLFGQVIADNVNFGGSSLVQVFNRPGGRPSAPGVGLVQ